MSLKYGYSTGACATALAVASLRRLAVCEEVGRVIGADGGDDFSKAVSPDVCEAVCGVEPVTVTFGDNSTRDIDIGTEGNWCTVLKDGGDDPDCTHGATLFGRMTKIVRPDLLDQTRDYLLRVDKAEIIIRAVEGIGLCTRPGLDCEPGKWAINVGPRRMIAAHLSRENLSQGVWLFELGIRGGERLAEKTLNRQLGVVGGLSVLGTTGLVRPFSHEAYIATVQLCARSWAQEGGRHLVLCTGGRTRRAAESLLSLPENAYTCIGDFIAESLEAARDNAMTEVTVACMAGKLCKYAAGLANTHAHKVPQDMALFGRELAALCPEADIHGCASVREALLRVPDDVQTRLLRRLAALAVAQFQRIVPTLRTHLLLCDFAGTPLLHINDEGAGA